MPRSELKRFFKESIILATVFIVAPFVCFFIYVRKFFKKNGEPRKILIIDNAKIGDLVCATPVFRAIKQKYPDCYLTVLVTPRVEGILRNNPHIDELIVKSLNEKKGFGDLFNLVKKIRKSNFDASINLTPGTLNFILPFLAVIPERISTVNDNFGYFYKSLARLATRRVIFKKNSLSVRHYLELLKHINIADQNLKKEVYFTDLAGKKAADFLSENGIMPQDTIVGFCLTAGNKIKEWGEENYAHLADEILKNYGFKIVAIGGPQDEAVLRKFGQLCGVSVIITYNDFLLEEIPALIKKFFYFVSSDTGPLYIANALDMPVLDILGPCSDLDQPPVYERCGAINVKNLECWPCSTVIKPATFCTQGHLKCLKEMSVEMVMEGFDKLVKKYPVADK